MAGETTDAQKTYAVTHGQWGGNGMNMVVSAAGATIEFDCASAEISKQLRMTKKGVLEGTGTLVSNGPGPVRIDREPNRTPIKFKGTVKGKTMVLSVTDADAGTDLGTFTLTHGSSGRIRRCL
ncbi:MAG TPA: hypothetical protein VL501_04895 [Pyrinomonadaceae bacterium]|nr:hypothetical protein [Pyrinomonadaceae bacterium]